MCPLVSPLLSQVALEWKCVANAAAYLVVPVCLCERTRLAQLRYCVHIAQYHTFRLFTLTQWIECRRKSWPCLVDLFFDPRCLAHCARVHPG